MKYTALRLVSIIYRGIGAFAFLAGILLAVSTLLGSARLSNYYGYNGTLAMSGLTPAIIIFIGGCLTGLGFYAIGELIQLMIAIENNTRSTKRALNWMLQQQLAKEQQRNPRKNDDMFDDF